MITQEVARLRQEYEAEGLVESKMFDDPFAQFETWFSGAMESGIEQPNAFVLATVEASGKPSARAVLMKEFSKDGLVFFTGLHSAKSKAMDSNRVAAATFVWLSLHRQIRFEGSVERVDDSTADDYFATRPRGAQIAAHASHQSDIVEGRDALDQRFVAFEEEFGDGSIPRPEHWGGWILKPSLVEFWQGQPNRFHDRVRYRSVGKSWVKERLAP